MDQRYSLTAKSGLSRAPMADSFLTALYRCLAPYRGCAHGCSYCDGRAEKYFVAGDFDREIGVRHNLVDLVGRQVEHGFTSREYGAVCIGSGVTDIYQPLEAELGLTRGLLEALLPAGLPLIILTKSDLIVRDFDLLRQFPSVLIAMTITTTDEGAAASLEPGAPPVARRLEALRKATAAGFSTGVMAMPLCPGISDSAEHFDALIQGAQAAGAGFVCPGGLTLRPGIQKEHFMETLKAGYPRLESAYRKLYANERASGLPRNGADRAPQLALSRRLTAAGIPQMIPCRIYSKMLALPDSFAVLFSHLQGLYDARGVNTSRLKSAAGLYRRWLKEERTALRRRKFPPVASDPWPITRILSERLLQLLRTDNSGSPPADGAPQGESGFAELCGNSKLAALCARLAPDGADFDYSALKLRAD